MTKDKQKSFMLSDLVSFLRTEAFLTTRYSFSEMQLQGFSPISNAQPNTVSWTRGRIPDNTKLESVVVLCSTDFSIPKLPGCYFIPVNNPRRAFAKCIERFAIGDTPIKAGIAQTTKIGTNCKISPDVYIGEYSIVEEDVTIGKNSIIESRVYIRSRTAIGKGCIIKSGSVIGGDGFGFCKAPDGTWEKFPHLGKVIIEDSVEIGSNTVINRSILGNTLVGKGTKIDSLVYIAHNVKIGANNIITANVTLAGGVSTGDNVWIGPSSSVLEGCYIGENAYIGMGTVVIRSVEASTRVVGVPARIIGKTV
ncbi:MAG: UDP-3-O-(3-hydroxymyristoyl)glucosamine N-acyltransferase [Planctomycetota bacterium]|jgi:UDP-3-O-[3-hydroxymyristoyl] glucosamine N-acyltransferase